MGKKERDKGGRGEREIVNRLKAAGFPGAYRNLNDKVDGKGTDIFAGNMDIQVKYWKKYAPISKYGEVAGGPGRIKLLVTKGTEAREPWMVCLSLEDFLMICNDIGVLYND